MKSNFNKLYNKIIKEQINQPIIDNLNNQLITITLDSAWKNIDAIQNFKNELQTEYNVIGIFNDGGIENSSWTLKGTIDDLRHVVNDFWLMNKYMTPDEVMDAETMRILGYDE